MHTNTHTHTHMGSKARPHTSTNLYSQSSSEIWNEGGWQGAWYPVWFPAPYEMPVALEAAFLGKGLPETVIRRSGFVPIYQYISKHNCRIPALHSNKDHQGSHLYISTLTITLLRSFFFLFPWAICTDVKCCSFFLQKEHRKLFATSSWRF